MYCDFYGFREKPFTVTPNPRFVFLSKNHREAFAHLLYGIDNHAGFILLTGEIGTGKTTVLRTLLSQLDSASVRSALILNPCLSARELLASINREFGIPWEGLKASELLDALNLFLLAENRAGHTVALVIDEAQNLDPQVLEQIRLISNLETETDKLIQIVLAGQPELADMLRRPELRQFGQRITVRYHLQPMDFDDTAAYIEHRMEMAGGRLAARFTRGALKRFFRYSGGIPRLLTIVCDRALLIGYVEERREISGKMAARAITEVSGRARWPAAARLALGAALALILMAAAGMYAVRQSPPMKSRPSQPESSASGASRPHGDHASAKSAPMPRKTLEGMSEADCATNAFNALAAIWNAGPLSGRENVRTPREQDRAAEARGLSLAPFNGSLNRLLSVDQPSLVEARLSRTGGRRYLALIGREGDRFIVSPPISGSSSLSRTELERFWSGHAVIPWRNFLNIPHLAPGMRGDSVTRLQELLQEAGVYKGTPTGRYDRETTVAITKFHISQGMAKSGRPSRQTLLLLYRNADRFAVPRLKKTGRKLPG